MTGTVIHVENISKLYRLGEVSTGTISHDLKRWWRRMRGEEDPYLQVGTTNDRTTKSDSEYVWALKDINFDIAPGEITGIIGRNGAGKSTLLKILSRTTTPTTGNIRIKGRVASLLEVGTGFHPELTGRDNIFLNGAILGMNKKEIKRKFDEIVEFAGVERYIDTPVKRYSSGMYVRLAFAVAAHLESEILIVDEVLAVGDTEFQKKCMGKMGDISKGQGRTVLFVSHNLQAVAQLCSTGILVHNGTIRYKGDIYKTIQEYDSLNKQIRFDASSEIRNPYKRGGSGAARFNEVVYLNQSGEETTVFSTGEDITFRIEVNIFHPLEQLQFLVGIKSANSNEFVTSSERHTIFENSPHNAGDKVRFSVVLKNIKLLQSEYTLYLWIGRNDGDPYDVLVDVTDSIRISNTERRLGFFKSESLLLNNQYSDVEQ